MNVGNAVGAAGSVNVDRDNVSVAGTCAAVGVSVAGGETCPQEDRNSNSKRKQACLQGSINIVRENLFILSFVSGECFFPQ